MEVMYKAYLDSSVSTGEMLDCTARSQGLRAACESWHYRG